MNQTLSLPPIEDILLHRDTMLLLDRLLAFNTDAVSAVYTPRGDAWYADAYGNMPAWIGIELMAQSVAAHVGLRKRNIGASPKHGVLLGTQCFVATRPVFSGGQALRVDARRLYGDASGLAAYACTLSVDDEEVASATLKVFEPDDFATLLETSRS